MKSFHEPGKELPVLAEVDVLVCGGGPAGVGAALAAARNGARTLLIEYQLCFGGQATSGMMNRLGPYHDQKNMILGGIPLEIARRLVEMKAALMPEPCPQDQPDRYWVPFDPEAMKVLLDELMTEAGVEFLFNTLVTQPIMAGNALRGAILENKAGRQAVFAKVVIDATGDADVAFRAGAVCGKGRERDGLMQPMGLLSKVHNLDFLPAREYFREHVEEIKELAKKEGAEGKPVPIRYHCGTDNILREDETYFNASHVWKQDGTDPRNLTDAAIAGRRIIWNNFLFMKRHVPGWEKAYLSATASQLGVRETRWVQGGYVLTLDDVLNARQFPDQIVRYACWIDTHSVNPGEPDPNEGRGIEPGTSYGIPYRCLVPEKTENLLVAGRCFSGVHEARASARMIPCCMAMGEAAGTAAALAVQAGLSPRNIPVDALRKQLEKQGVML
jgi:hypothetical protein